MVLTTGPPSSQGVVQENLSGRDSRTVKSVVIAPHR